MNGEKVAATVLVVEDEWLIAEYLRDALEDSGYSVAGPASRVSQALTLIEKNGFDVAILDVSLHAEYSFPVAHALIKRSIPFLFMTGYVTTDMPNDLQGQLVLHKPIEIAELIFSIEKMLTIKFGDRLFDCCLSRALTS